MLNLLLISDSPKAEYIKNVLQPVLKVIIDIATDFDSGLKDVFEKRPATVCIQDQIGGVTGESVARHIQMLLGNSAPKFILLHTGNARARAIKGLYEHTIDLSQSHDTLAEEIKSTLKLLTGVQWEKIFIPPKFALASKISSVAVPEESRDDADKLVDDFISDLEMPGFSAANGKPQVTSTPDTIPKESSGSGQPGATLPLEVVRNGRRNESSAAVSPQPPLTTAAADFRITQNKLPADEYITEDMFLEFEENFRSESLLLRRNVVIAFVCIVLAAVCLYLVVQNPQLVSSLKQRFTPPSAVRQKPVTVSVQKPLSAPGARPVVIPPLPAFIPKDGHDGSFAVKNPGWERYVGKLNEFRVFSASGRIQAVQVLAVKDVPISESLIKSVLQEFSGGADYQITSRNTKAGVLVERGRVHNRGEVLIYRKNGVVKAFVVSVS